MTYFDEAREVTFRLKFEIEKLNLEDRTFKRTVELLSPLVELVLHGRFDELPGTLPEHRFFWGLQDDCLAAWHLNEGQLLAAIYEFDKILRKLKGVPPL